MTTLAFIRRYNAYRRQGLGPARAWRRAKFWSRS